MVNCIGCNTDFYKALAEINRTDRHFCTQSCAATFNNKLRKRKSQKKIYQKLEKVEKVEVVRTPKIKVVRSPELYPKNKISVLRHVSVFFSKDKNDITYDDVKNYENYKIRYTGIICILFIMVGKTTLTQ
jgi:hypothetical protein